MVRDADEGRDEVAGLLSRIDAGFSEVRARRFRELDELRIEGRLRPDELAEFRALAGESERIRLDRLKAIVELAQLRGVSVPELMARIGLSP